MLVRVATWNIKHGARRPERLAAVVRGLADVDVLALQEVDVGDPRSGEVDQVAVVADALGMASVFGRSLTTSRGGDYGVALLVRGELTATHLALPEPSDEDRSALLAAVDVRGARLSVAATHLSVRRANSRAQLDRVIDELRLLPAPRVLLGDLNRTLRELGHVDDLVFTRAAGTFPRCLPRMQIDHVAVSPDVAVVQTEVRHLRLSDHRALVVDLDLPPTRSLERDVRDA